MYQSRNACTQLQAAFHPPLKHVCGRKLGHAVAVSLKTMQGVEKSMQGYMQSL